MVILGLARRARAAEILSSIRGKYIIPLVISLGVFGYVLIFGWPYTFQLIFVANSFIQER